MEYKAITKASLEEAFKWAQVNFRSYEEYAGAHWSKSKYLKNNKYLEKEFIFRGYVPLNTFHKETGYNYIQSNQAINGTRYIYPQKCCRRWDIPDHSKYPNPYTFHANCGIPGYTGVDVNYKL